MMAIWGEALVVTALLIGAVLLLRQPVARLLGPQCAYLLWLLPTARLILPPLPGGEQVVAWTSDELAVQIARNGEPEMLAPSLWDLAVAGFAAHWVLVWLAGFCAVVGYGCWQHRRWHRALMAGGITLAPLGRIRLVMSSAVDGPVATGLLRPVIAVPQDFFARYNRAERALAIDHELAHHRAGDLWINAAALIVLAAQWFNPLAWTAIRAFRFDQEAACDARVLARIAPPERPAHTHSYARAIAKSLAGPRLVLAAPMTSGNGVKERLKMLNDNPRLAASPLFGRMLIGGAVAAVLTATISTLPARTVFAAEPPAVPAPPPPPPAAAEGKKARHIIMLSEDGERTFTFTRDGDPPADAQRRTIHRVVIDHDNDGKDAAALGEGIEQADKFRFAIPFPALAEKDLRATLKAEGIDDAKADAIVKKLAEKRAVPMPPIPPIPPMAFNWRSGHDGVGVVVASTKCSSGDSPNVMIDRSGSAPDGKARVRMVRCGEAMGRANEIAAMKKVRDRLAASRDGGALSKDIRAAAVADLEKAIAELEAKQD